MQGLPHLLKISGHAPGGLIILFVLRLASCLGTHHGKPILHSPRCQIGICSASYVCMVHDYHLTIWLIQQKIDLYTVSIHRICIYIVCHELSWPFLIAPYSGKGICRKIRYCKSSQHCGLMEQSAVQ